MSNPATVQACCMIAFRDQGIVSLNPSTPQANELQPTDVDAMAVYFNQAAQEAADESPDEHLRQPGSAYLGGPVNATLTVTQGSTSIAALTPYLSTMNGCTIRISGDTMDNEILGQTLLARPYEGTTGTAVAATIYSDCISEDATVEKIIAPMLLSGNRVVFECSTRAEFISRCYLPIYNNANGTMNGIYLPFWGLGPKPTGQFPTSFFLDSYYDPLQDHPTHRIRLSPMPLGPQTIFWTNKMTPIRVTRADIISGLNTLTATGATSDTNANQDYAYAADYAGYRLYSGVTHSAWTIYFNPNNGRYILINGFVTGSISALDCWTVTSGSLNPLGQFDPLNGAIGTVTVTTSDTGGGAADPGTKINMPNGWAEGIFIPILRQVAAGAPTFKNDGIRPEIQRQYQRALGRLRSARVSSAPARTVYT